MGVKRGDAQIMYINVLSRRRRALLGYPRDVILQFPIGANFDSRQSDN